MHPCEITQIVYNVLVPPVHFINNATLTCLSAQIIQRQLEQVEEKQRQLEERGVAVEKALRGEAGNDLSFIPSYIVLFFLINLAISCGVVYQ